MSQFTKLNLTGERVLVKGTDDQGTEGSTVLDASEWNEVLARKGLKVSHADFDREVEEFFAPLMAAAEKVEAAHKPKEVDPITVVVFDEGEEGTPSRTKELVRLGHDSIVLRLLEDGKFERLVWVNDTLEVLDAVAPVAVTMPDNPAVALDDELGFNQL